MRLVIAQPFGNQPFHGAHRRIGQLGANLFYQHQFGAGKTLFGLLRAALNRFLQFARGFFGLDIGALFGVSEDFFRLGQRLGTALFVISNNFLRFFEQGFGLGNVIGDFLRAVIQRRC